MSSSNWSSPPPVPFKFTQNNIHPVAVVHVDDNMPALGDAPSSSPLRSSSPVRTPSRRTPGNGCAEWPAGGYFVDPDASYEQQDKLKHVSHLWSWHTPPAHLFPSQSRPLPSLISKFAAQRRKGDAAPSHSPSSLSSDFPTMHVDPQESATAADDCEEYDLESMDIHIRETYFATSAERGRWLSSPIAPRVRSRATPPARGHSSPVKRPADSSPKCSPTRPRFCSVGEPISLSEEGDATSRCFSSLPPSSPPFSPMSNLSFLGDECENDSAVDPRSSAGCYRSGTPELNISPTGPEPVGPVLLPNPDVTLTPVHPSDSLSCPPVSMTRFTNSFSGHSPISLDVHAQTLDTEPDDALSPLSQFELDLAEEEDMKLPFSDTVNKPHPGQRGTGSGVIVHVQDQEGTSSMQSLSMNSNVELDVTLNVFNSSCSNGKVRKRRRGSTIGNPGTRRTKKRNVNRSGGLSSDMEGTRNWMSSHPEPRSKKIKLSPRVETHGGKSHARRTGGCSRSPLRSVAEDDGLESAQSHHGSIKPVNAQPLKAIPPDAMSGNDAEFHASMTGMLIEAFATSRATSMDSAALYSVLTQAHPRLAEEQPKEELVVVIATVLEAGRVRCGMFNKVDSSGEKSRHKALENRWFYVPERDEDRERASLISAIMPRQKRNETKKYKQYYYRPLDKISRWDPEDAP